MQKLRLIWGTALFLGATNVMAATYYVKPTGSDSADGKTHATAWKSLAKVNGVSFQPGDDVYFLAGSQWVGQLVVDWSGTESNRVEIGSYYVENDRVVRGVPTGTSRPTLVGGYPKVNVTGAIPGPWKGLVEVAANYVTIRDMRTYKSSGTGINLAKGFHHATFENNQVEITAGSSILFQRETHDNVMRGNEASFCAQAWKDGTWIGVSWPICNGAVGSWNNLIEKNYIHESYGEGIVAFGTAAYNNVIRNNLLVWVRSANIYVDNGSDNLVENNVVIGNGGNGLFQRSASGYSGTAFSVAVEYYPNMDNAVRNVFRNNLAAGSAGCFNVGMEQEARDGGYQVGAEFIGNTCVGTWSAFNITPPNVNIQSIKVVNNIISDVDDGTVACKAPTSSKVVFQNNLWNIVQSDADCRGSGDIIGVPKLSKSSGWRNGSPSNIFKATDFKPLAGSSVFGAGRALSNLTVDHFATKRPTVPAIGAIDANSPVAKVATPLGLKLTITP